MYIALTCNKCEMRTFLILQSVLLAKVGVSRYFSVKIDIDSESKVFKSLNKIKGS